MANARLRIIQQLGTAYPGLAGVAILLDEPAVRTDGTEFADHDVHHALVAAGIKRPGGEWFEATLDEVRVAINNVRTGKSFDPKRTQSFEMRPEQGQAVEVTSAYFGKLAQSGGGKAPKFLWNAKMRFGKTFTTYQLALEMGWKRVLVLTYKPAVQTQWRDDLLTHIDFDGWRFIDRDTDDDERDAAASITNPLVWFASFQDLRGKTADGKIKAHNETVHLVDWDCIVLDEYHFGAWRDSARDLYDPTDKSIAEEEEPEDWVTDEDLGLTSAHYLYLSGTPFRAITNGEFTEDAVFNWTYVDEQSEKERWDSAAGPNPYTELPRMEMYAYEIGEDATAWAEDGEFNGFALNDFFTARKMDPQNTASGTGGYIFEDPTQVSEFLAMLRGKLSGQMKTLIVAGQKPPFPYESVKFKGALKHSIWYLPDVAACFAMRDILLNDAYFSSFEIVVAAGAKTPQGAAAKPPVEVAIGKAIRAGGSGSITLSCGKLMTGVTIKEWGAIFMLRSLKSPESYFQAAFRVQSPWAYRDPEGNLDVRKDTCFVFEFDPNRALTLVAEYAIRLASSGESSTPSEVIGQLLNYLPIYGFAGGTMTQLDASAVLDWATAGVGATALAQRWNSPLLVDVNERTLAGVLDHPGLMATLEQIEEFRALVNNAEQVVTSTKLLKKAKREQGASSTRGRRGRRTRPPRNARRFARSCRSSSPRFPCSCMPPTSARRP